MCLAFFSSPSTFLSHTNVCWTITSWKAFREPHHITPNLLIGLSHLRLMMKPAMKWWIPEQNTKSLQLSCRLKLCCREQHRWMEHRERDRTEVECRKTVVFVLSIRANEQVQLQVCAHMFACQLNFVCARVLTANWYMCVLIQLEESDLSVLH